MWWIAIDVSFGAETLKRCKLLSMSPAPPFSDFRRGGVSFNQEILSLGGNYNFKEPGIWNY